MAINNKLPKGVSNSAKMGATPGTQRTAQQNVMGGGNINPNMPIATQLEKQARSNYQKSILGQPTAPVAPVPAPGAAPPRAAAPAPRQTPVVSRGMPLDPGRGYNVFSGMDADQISGMNQKMGLSNMTALPSLSKGFEVDPAVTNLVPGEQMSAELMYLMPGDEEEEQDDNSVTIGGGDDPGLTQTATLLPNGVIKITYSDGSESFVYPGTPDYQVYSEYFPDVDKEKETEYLAADIYSTFKSVDDAQSKMPKDPGPGASEEEYQNYLFRLAAWEKAFQQYMDEQYEKIQEGSESGDFTGQAQGDEIYQSAYDYSQGLVPGIDPVQKQQMFDNLDEEYARKLQAAMLGLDRQAAMMGTFGSGGHMMSLNTAVAQVLTEMAGQYNQIEMLDVELQKTDEQNKIDNALQIGASIEGSIDHKLNMGMKVLDVIVAPYGDWITANFPKGDPKAQQLREYLLTATGDLFANLLSQGKTVEQALFEAFQEVALHFNQLGHYPDIVFDGTLANTSDYESGVNA